MLGTKEKVYTQAEAREGWLAISGSSVYEHLKQLDIHLPSQLVAAVNHQKTMVDEGEYPLGVLIEICEIPALSAMILREYYPAIEVHFTWLDHAIANKTLMSGFKPSTEPSKPDNGSSQPVNAKEEVKDMPRAEKPIKEVKVGGHLTWFHMMSRPNFKMLDFKDEAEFVQELVAYNGDCRGLVKERSHNKFKLGRTPEMVERYCRAEELLTAEGELTALAYEKVGGKPVSQLADLPETVSPEVSAGTERALAIEAGGLGLAGSNGDDLAKSMIAMLAAATHHPVSVPLAPGVAVAARAAVLKAPMAMLVGQFSSLLPLVEVAEKSLALIKMDDALRKHLEGGNSAEACLAKAAELLVEAGRLIKGNG